MLEGKLVNRVVQYQDLITLLDQPLDDGRFHQIILRFTSDEVDVVLTCLGSSDIVVE